MIIHGSREQLAEKAAEILCKTISELLQQKETVVIAVPGGRSVAGIYHSLQQYTLPWSRIHIFLLDERLLPEDHPESNYKLVKDHIGSNVPPDMLHQFNYTANNSSQAVFNYEKELERFGGLFDIVLASSGEDGHIASLFPNHHSVKQEKNGFFMLNDAPKPPPNRMSASYNLIRQASAGIILFFGSGKLGALHNFFDTGQSYKACPAKIIAELPHYYLLTDQEVETP